jgi:DeoR family suf operon transcriptional repressor
LKAKVAELTRILDGDGYLATFEMLTPGLFRIVEHNCAIWAVAQRYGQACSSEIEFIRAVLPEADVERVQHMVAGAPHCAYEVRAKVAHS